MGWEVADLRGIGRPPIYHHRSEPIEVENIYPEIVGEGAYEAVNSPFGAGFPHALDAREVSLQLDPLFRGSGWIDKDIPTLIFKREQRQRQPDAPYAPSAQLHYRFRASNRSVSVFDDGADREIHLTDREERLVLASRGGKIFILDPSEPVELKFVGTEGIEGRIIEDAASGLTWFRLRKPHIKSRTDASNLARLLRFTLLSHYGTWRLPTAMELSGLLAPIGSQAAATIADMFDLRDGVVYSSDTWRSGPYGLYTAAQRIRHIVLDKGEGIDEAKTLLVSTSPNSEEPPERVVAVAH
jgi:hypothetical protein